MSLALLVLPNQLLMDSKSMPVLSRTYLLGEAAAPAPAAPTAVPPKKKPAPAAAAAPAAPLAGGAATSDPAEASAAGNAKPSFKKRVLGGAAKGAAKGALGGGVAGSVLPGIGTLAGAGAGALGGAAVGAGTEIAKTVGGKIKGAWEGAKEGWKGARTPGAKAAADANSGKPAEPTADPNDPATHGQAEVDGVGAVKTEGGKHIPAKGSQKVNAQDPSHAHIHPALAGMGAIMHPGGGIWVPTQHLAQATALQHGHMGVGGAAPGAAPAPNAAPAGATGAASTADLFGGAKTTTGAADTSAGTQVNQPGTAAPTPAPEPAPEPVAVPTAGATPAPETPTTPATPGTAAKAADTTTAPPKKAPAPAPAPATAPATGASPVEAKKPTEWGKGPGFIDRVTDAKPGEEPEKKAIGPAGTAATDAVKSRKDMSSAELKREMEAILANQIPYVPKAKDIPPTPKKPKPAPNPAPNPETFVDRVADAKTGETTEKSVTDAATMEKGRSELTRRQNALKKDVEEKIAANKPKTQEEPEPAPGKPQTDDHARTLGIGKNASPEEANKALLKKVQDLGAKDLSPEERDKQVASLYDNHKNYLASRSGDTTGSSEKPKMPGPEILRRKSLLSPPKTGEEGSDSEDASKKRLGLPDRGGPEVDAAAETAGGDDKSAARKAMVAASNQHGQDSPEFKRVRDAYVAKHSSDDRSTGPRGGPPRSTIALDTVLGTGKAAARTKGARVTQSDDEPRTKAPRTKEQKAAAKAAAKATQPEARHKAHHADLPKDHPAADIADRIPKRNRRRWASDAATEAGGDSVKERTLYHAKMERYSKKEPGRKLREKFAAASQEGSARTQAAAQMAAQNRDPRTRAVQQELDFASYNPSLEQMIQEWI